MNATLSILDGRADALNTEKESVPDWHSEGCASSWDGEAFAREQIRGLVRKVFFPGWPQPARQVVFSAADSGMDISQVCVRTARALAEERAGSVCVVETDFASRALENSYGRTSTDGGGFSGTAGTMRKSSPQISGDVCLIPADAFLGMPENAHSAVWLRSRLAELRQEFDYAVIHAGAVTQSAGTPCWLTWRCWDGGLRARRHPSSPSGPPEPERIEEDVVA